MEGQASAPRRAPASGIPNNQDVFIWSLFQLGGAEHDVDVEAIFLRSFDLAPARLGWRTRPDLPDYKKAAKALQSVESRTHVGLVHRTSPYLRRLTTAGALWVEQNRLILERTYNGGAPVRAAPTNEHERRRRMTRGSTAFTDWSAGRPIRIEALADALECSPASPETVWASRILELERAAAVLADAELADFVEAANSTITAQIRG